MNVTDFYATETKWLKAADLGGRKHKVVIDSLEIVEFKKDGANNKKVGIHFANREKGLMLNKTNAGLISRQYGGDSDNWIGQTITIYPTTTDFGGEMVDCIRVELPVPEAGDEDTPF